MNGHLAHHHPSRATGVYVGVSQLEYARISLESGGGALNTYYATGAHLSVASGARRDLADAAAAPIHLPLVTSSGWLPVSINYRPPVLHLRLQGPRNDSGHCLFLLPGHHTSRCQGQLACWVTQLRVAHMCLKRSVLSCSKPRWHCITQNLLLLLRLAACRAWSEANARLLQAWVST